MKTSAALSLAVYALSATASIVRRAPGTQRDLPAFAIPKSGFNKEGGNSDHPDTNQPVKVKSPTTSHANKHTDSSCLTRAKLEPLVDKYLATFAGVTDGGKQARQTFESDFKLYSQSVWWTTASDTIDRYQKNDDFPPVFKTVEQLIKGNEDTTNDPNAFIKGPVGYGCNFFSLYWKGDFTVKGGTNRGRGNGIDMVFVNPTSGKISRAYSEYNTLNQVSNWGAHITWSKDPVCCDCPVVFNPQCKCPGTK
ncbi:hypothetical protein NM208_g15370 [Fusarium decemcellulare]|uniref:Uncharacterized protein n=1 Tax=Fusarium decemcellulare TaxID=57161 RepID=A0ACC1REF7_9HYPO|nr:hypothetical protein NM208_g15370 [Fusarium decemcellulare]